MGTSTRHGKHPIYTTSFAGVYPHYVAKAEKKGRTQAEVDEIIRWLTGYTQRKLESQLDKGVDFETFFAEAPTMNPSRALTTGVVCGVRVEDVEEPTMREIRYLDKLVDEGPTQLSIAVLRLARVVSHAACSCAHRPSILPG